MFWNDRLCLIVGYVSASNVVITRMRTVALAPVSLVASPSSSLSFLLLLLLLLLHLLVLMVVVMVVIEVTVFQSATHETNIPFTSAKALTLFVFDILVTLSLKP